MKILFSSSVNLDANSAQALQIKSMIDAFSRVYLGNISAILCSDDYKASYEFSTSDIQLIKPLDSKLLRRIQVLLRTLYFGFSNTSIFYTREIFVALIGTFFFKRVAYEAHKLPVSFVSYIFTYLFLLRDNSRLIVITASLKASYSQLFKVRSESLHVIHDSAPSNSYRSVDILDRQNWRSLLIPSHCSKLALHTGSLYKGGIDVFKQLSQIDPNIFILHIGATL